MQIFRNRVVVEDGAVTNDNQEIELSVARKIEPDFEVGEDVSEEIKIDVWVGVLFWRCVRI